MAYQDRWVRGATTATGDRSCADRYALIREVVAPYSRPITVWDLGANLGYFGCRLAHEFGCVSVMVDKNRELATVCQANALPTTIAITRALTSAELSDLAACEHADVVLALNVLHRVEDWRGWLSGVLALGDTIVIETPARDETTAVNFQQVGAITDAIEAEGAEQIGETRIPQSAAIRRPVYVIRRVKTAVSRACCALSQLRRKGSAPPRPHTIDATRTSKTVTFEGELPRAWLPGMNLWNWALLGGSYPDRTTVEHAIHAARARLSGPHGDFRLWNLILQGQTVTAIDAGHRRSVDDDQAVAEAVSWLARPEVAFV
jgi:hypothetical protein